MRDKTVEEEGSGTFVEQTIEAKTAAIATIKTSEGMAREALAVEAPRIDMAAILGMMPRAAGSSTDAAPAEPSETDEEEQTPTEPDTPDSDEDTAAEDRLMAHFGQTRRTPTPTAKPKTAAAKTTAKPNTSPGKTTPKPKSPTQAQSSKETYSVHGLWPGRLRPEEGQRHRSLVRPARGGCRCAGHLCLGWPWPETGAVSL